MVLLVSCSAAPAPLSTATLAPSPVPSDTPEPTATTSPTPLPPTASATVVTRTPTITVTATPSYPLLGYGPTDFPSKINPLTGLEVAKSGLLDRRPIVIKVENLPREDRPQWGLSFADIIYEYYTEQGGTRFAAVYYGNDAPTVGPIRSARFFDFNVVRMYKASFVFGYAYADLFSALTNSEFSNRMILEGERWKGVFTRYQPQGANILQTNTALIADAMAKNKVDNTRQNLDGMLFQLQTPPGGQDGKQVFVRFSGGIYNRWDYDQASGKYLRYADAADDVNRNNEKYAQLTDRVNKQPIAAENVVVIEVAHKYIQKPPAEVVDMQLLGEGSAWLARDGKVYPLKWKRAKNADVLTLIDENGSPFAFKPGQTWFEILGINSTASGKDGVWKFVHMMP